MGFAALVDGNYPLAVTRFEEMLVQARDRSHDGPSMVLAFYLRLLAWAACYAGDVLRATDLFGEAVAVSQELGDTRGIAASLEGLAGLAGARGKPRDAARIFGAAESLRIAIRAPADQAERLLRERCLDSVREALGPEAFRETRSEGRAMTRSEGLAYALRST